MDKFTIFKNVVGTAAGMGAARIIGKAVYTYIPRDTLFERIFVPVGSFALGSLVGDAVRVHTEKKMDEISAGIDEIIAKNNANK